MIISTKELFLPDITMELYSYYKEQLINLYDQLSHNQNLKMMKDNSFIDFLNRSRVFLYVSDRIEILGAITVLYEKKIIHNGGIVAHIEDFVVHKDHRGKGIGKELMNHAIEDSRKNKVYKVILDCKDDMITYYEKFGYESKNVQMSLYFE